MNWTAWACIISTRYVNQDGYAVLDPKVGKEKFHHRLIYKLANNYEFKQGDCVCHYCDVRNCIQEKHLFLGTHADNMRDMARKKRAASMPGQENPNSILTEKDVRQIRFEERNTDRKLLSERYGVSKSTIDFIHQGKTWTHIK